MWSRAPIAVPVDTSVRDVSLREFLRLDDMVDAILQSLYWDQILPAEADVLRRASELYPDDAYLNDAALRAVVARNPAIYTLANEFSGRDIYELVQTPPWFSGWVDPSDLHFVFSIEVWEGLSHFMVCSVDRAGDSFTARLGGRYGLAKKLQHHVQRLYDLDKSICEYCRVFFESIQFFTLGRLCQLVQRAIYEGLLRYENNLLQPVSSCEGPSVAFACKYTGTSSTSLPHSLHSVAVIPHMVTREIESADELCHYLDLLMESESTNELHLSQLKKKLISKFEIVLNPARLGCIKLSDAIACTGGEFQVISNGNNSFAVIRSASSEDGTPTTFSGGEDDWKHRGDPLNSGY